MAFVKKYNRKAVNLLLRHNLRETKADGTYYRHSNANIDTTMTKHNINMMPWRDAREHHRYRCNSVYIYGENGKHADEIVYMAEWIVTLPQDVHDDDVAKFFKHTHEFLCERYGEENAIASNVHFDEVTPHLHFDFVPVTYDKKRKRDKLCAKDVLTKKDLQSFHQDLSDFLESRLGYRCSILTGERAGKSKDERKKNLTIEQLKAQTRERVKSLSMQIEETQERIKECELQESEDALYEKKQDEYLRHQRLNEKQAIIDVNENNKLLISENEKLTSENNVLKTQNVILNDKVERQEEALSILDDVFEIDTISLTKTINDVAYDDNVKSAIRNAAAQLVRVVQTAFQYYKNIGYIR